VFLDRLLKLSLVFLLASACENDDVEYIEPDSSPVKLTRIYSPVPKPYRSAELFSKGIAIATYGKENALEAQDYWALAECRCYYNHKGQKLFSSLGAKGVLPEVKTFPVRKEILENDLLKVANGLLGNLGQSLANVFVSDETVKEAITEGINEGMWASVPDGSNITTQNLTLDAFHPWYSPSQLDTDKFEVTEQTTKWLTIFSLDQMFQGGRSKIYQDHGLQVFHIIRSLVELQYAFGLDGYRSIGLTLNPSYQFNLATFDPRVNDGPGRTISGSYKITYDKDKSLLKQSISETEKWSHGGEELTLSEQSRLWMAMAYVFKNLRPKNRKYIGQMFEREGGLLPTDSHLLALSILPSLSDILADKLVDPDKRIVRSAVDKYGNATGLADAVDLARLINSVQLWASELGDLEDVDVKPELKTKLSEAVPSFKDVVRLSVQHLINHYLQVASNGEVSVLKAVDYDLSKAGEVAEALLKVNSNFIESDLLTELSVEVTRSYLYYAIKKLTVQPEKVYFSDVIWIKRVIDVLSDFSSEKIGLDWLPEVKGIVEAYILK